MDLGNNTISVSFHWSGEVMAITIVTLVVIVYSFIQLEIVLWPKMLLWLKYLLMIILISAVAIGVAYMPKKLKICEEKVILVRLFNQLEIPKSEIVEVKRITKFDTDGSMRIFGSGGFFGYLGSFRNEKLGNYVMYATELNNLILICTKNKKYIFSCSDPDKVVKYIDLQMIACKDIKNVE
ncbi:MAG: hypothetical protein IKA75_03240 [Bacteroidaceae bacterium]|nr:hypothetical protein [Bacteroidaceae bacterium]